MCIACTCYWLLSFVDTTKPKIVYICCEYKNISLSVAPPLMERSYRLIPNGVLMADTEGY